MRLEAKDRQNPHLICVATITNTKDGQLLIHFDGWSNAFDYWCKPDSTDIHPAMWCGKRGQSVQPPKGECTISLSTYALTSLDFKAFLYNTRHFVPTDYLSMIVLSAFCPRGGGVWGHAPLGNFDFGPFIRCNFVKSGTFFAQT